MESGRNSSKISVDLSANGSPLNQVKPEKGVQIVVNDGDEGFGGVIGKN